MASDRRRKRRVTPVWLANLWVVVTAALVAAFAGLVADDLMSKDGRIEFVWTRFVAFLVVLALLLAALWFRGTAYRNTGTLFQVQVLDEGMSDKRAASSAAAEQDRMAVRSITRWVDFRHRANSHGVIEVVDLCQTVSDILEDQINVDSPDTGYTVAPVMAWPIALAVGTQLPHGDRLRLLELEDDHGNPSNLIPLVQPSRSIDRSVPLSIHGGASDTGHVGVWIALTVGANAFDAHEADRWAELGVSEGVRITLGPDLPDAPSLTNADVTGLGAAIADALVGIRLDNPGRDIVVVAMMTKIVSMAVGWHLAQAKCRFFDRTHLMWFDEDRRRLMPMRVKESQPSLPPGPADA